MFCTVYIGVICASLQTITLEMFLRCDMTDGWTDGID